MYQPEPDEVSQIAQTVATAVAALGGGPDPGAAAAELTSLLARPWRAYRGPAGAYSPLTDSGAPFELSLKLGGEHGPTLRYVVDTADRRHGLAANLPGYLAAALRTTACGEPTLRRLFARHLDGAPPDEPPRVMHGVGLGPAGRRRASLYFPSGWHGCDLPDRFPEQVAAVRRAHLLLRRPVTDRIEVIGYDFVAGEAVRWKTYSWFPVDAVTARADAARWGDHLAGLGAAARLYAAFAAGVGAQHRERCVFLQLTSPVDGGAGDPGGKLFFFTRPWGWHTGDGLGTLLGFLRDTLALDLRPLMVLRSITAARAPRLRLGLLAVGGEPGAAAVTFYLWPATADRSMIQHPAAAPSGAMPSGPALAT